MRTESKRRNHLDELLRERFRIDPATPCAHRDHQQQNGDYCGGTLAAQYDRLPSTGGDLDNPENIIVLCWHHHTLRDMNRRGEAFSRDRDDMSPTWLDGPIGLM